MDLSRLEDLRIAMRLAGIKAHKGLGQHFLVDGDSLRMVIEAADLTQTDVVLEIGPGLGVMTGLLAGMSKRVVAVETDQVLSDLLQRDAPDNLEVISEDIMHFNLGKMGPKYKVVANLPYYLTSKILRLLLESPNPPQIMSLLVQKEVAERITAEPGNMSVLGLSVQYYAKVQLVGMVERHKFWPPPKVDSAVVRILRLPKPVFAADNDKLFRLIKAGFSQKRKQLKNALAGGLNISVLAAAEVISQADLLPAARAQELSLAQWQQLYRRMMKRGLLG